MNPQVRRARKKPVEIEFMVWPGGPAAATPVIDWILGHDGTATWDEEHIANPGTKHEEIIPEALTIRTLEGDMRALPGDAIIRGVKGEFYPCRADIFRDTYEITTDQGET